MTKFQYTRNDLRLSIVSVQDIVKVLMIQFHELDMVEIETGPDTIEVTLHSDRVVLTSDIALKAESYLRDKTSIHLDTTVSFSSKEVKEKMELTVDPEFWKENEDQYCVAKDANGLWYSYACDIYMEETVWSWRPDNSNLITVTPTEVERYNFPKDVHWTESKIINPNW